MTKREAWIAKRNLDAQMASAARPVDQDGTGYYVEGEGPMFSAAEVWQHPVSLVAAGEHYRSLREQAEVARQAMNESICRSSATMSESEIARIAGVTRVTVRKALGKSPTRGNR
jgi:hypothetical protein